MKPVPSNEFAHVTNVDRSKRMSIDSTAVNFLMSTLTDLYSNKPLAVIREYSTNALDSHIEAGNPDPILVSLPTSSNPVLTIQDFGVGLSHDDIEQIYSLYGASTKRDSNEVVGMLGLGCKSGLTLCDQFTLEAVKDGEISVCIITRDEDGVGVIKTLFQGETDLPNGVKVEFPIEASKVAVVLSEAENFFQYWEPGTVLLDGQAPDSIYDGYTQVSEDCWISLNQRGFQNRHFAVMGNVPYPVQGKIDSRLATITRIPIGMLDVTPSREALHYTDHTNNTLTELNKYIQEALKYRLLTLFNECPNEFERWKFAHTWRSYITLPPAIATQYGSIPLPEDRHGYACNGYKASKIERLSLNHGLLSGALVIKNFPLRGLTDSHKEKIRLYRSANDIAGDQWVVVPDGTDLMQLNGYERVVDWSEIAVMKPERQGNSNSSTEFSYTYKKQGRLHSLVSSEAWEGEVVYSHPRDNIHFGSDQFKEGMAYVLVNKTLLKRFLKLNPEAVYYSDYRAKERQNFLKGLNDTDRLKYAFSNHYYFRSLLQGIASKPHLMALIQDPELKLLCRASDGNNRVTPHWLGIGVNDFSKESAFIEGVKDRYPLVAEGAALDHLEEVIFYLNSKYNYELENNS